MTVLKLVTLDMTGTLLAFKTPIMEQYASIAAKYGIQADINNLQQNFKTGWKMFSKEHPNFGKDTGMGWENWWRNVVMHTFKDNNCAPPVLSNIADDLLIHFETDNAWILANGGHHLLRSLKERQLKLGVISNFDPRLHIILKSLKVYDYFDFVLTSYEYGHAKPNKKIFLEALKISSLEKPSMALHVGNDEILDFNAAKNAGFQSIQVNISEEEKFPYILKNISSVMKSVDFLNQKT